MSDCSSAENGPGTGVTRRMAPHRRLLHTATSINCIRNPKFHAPFEYPDRRPQVPSTAIRSGSGLSAVPKKYFCKGFLDRLRDAAYRADCRAELHLSAHESLTPAQPFIGVGHVDDRVVCLRSSVAGLRSPLGSLNGFRDTLERRSFPLANNS